MFVFEKSSVLYFFETLVLRLALLPYYRRIADEVIINLEDAKHLTEARLLAKQLITSQN